MMVHVPTEPSFASPPLSHLTLSRRIILLLSEIITHYQTEITLYGGNANL